MSATSSIIPFDSGTSYVVRSLDTNEQTPHRVTDWLGRTTQDITFLSQFERIFLAAGAGNLDKCKQVVDEGFRDLHAFSVGRFGTEAGERFNVSPIEIAKIKGHAHITEYFQTVLAGTHNNPIQPEQTFSLKKPAFVKIDEESVTEYASTLNIKTLAKELIEKGPHVAWGKFGPNSYKASPFKLEKPLSGYEIYGWKPGAERHERSNIDTVLLLGAKQVEEKGYVYFTPACDATQDKRTLIRIYKPSPFDTKIYVVSNKTFFDNIIDIFPPLALTSDMNRIASFSLETILDRGPVEAECRAIGQKLFDQAKAKAQGDSFEGGQAMQDFCERLRNACSDGKLRVQHLERAWIGIGDEEWQWM